MLASALVLALSFSARYVTVDTSVADLIAADSAFSAAAATHGLRGALEQYLAEDVIVPLPGGTFARGTAARDALDRPPFAAGVVSWAPIRAGISADGTHGFTLGFITVVRQDSAPAYAKYMAYWERQDGVWRVRAYKRAPAEAGAVSEGRMGPSLPAAAVAPADAAQHAQDRSSLAAAEVAFSAEAQHIGLAAAFARFGSDDAVNMGPPDRGFIVGAANIGLAVGAGTPTDSSPVSWAADYEVIVSPAGDLGVTFGIIRRNGAQAGTPGFAFFTIWRRADRSAPWRYIAE